MLPVSTGAAHGSPAETGDSVTTTSDSSAPFGSTTPGTERAARMTTARESEPGHPGPGSQTNVDLDAFRTVLRSPHRQPFTALLHHLCVQIVEQVQVADLAGVVLMDPDFPDPSTAACTHPSVIDVDLDQHRAGHGPYIEAVKHRTTVRARATDTDATARWPTFIARSTAMGIGSYLSAPLSLDERRVGALNVYSHSPHGFDEFDEKLVTIFVTAVESAIWNARRVAQAQTQLDELQHAIETRSVIDQAKGMIMAARGVSANAAFEILVEQSQRRNVKLAVIARELTESVGASIRA